MANERDKLLKERRKATEEQNKAAIKRTENVQPTPTQEELDRAALGIESLEELDDKDDHGAEEVERQVVSDTPGSYSTRAASTQKK